MDHAIPENTYSLMLVLKTFALAQMEMALQAPHVQHTTPGNARTATMVIRSTMKFVSELQNVPPV